MHDVDDTLDHNEPLSLPSGMRAYGDTYSRRAATPHTQTLQPALTPQTDAFEFEVPPHTPQTEK